MVADPGRGTGGLCRTHILAEKIPSESRVTIRENQDFNAADLFFLIKTTGRAITATDIAGWFDDAHAIIHHLFDELVHEQVKQSLAAGQRGLLT